MHSVLSQVIAVLIAIESGGRTDAVGDGGRAVGCLQMWPQAVAEANRLEALAARREHRVARVWTLEDRRDSAKSRSMAEVVLAFHYRRGTTNTVDLACRWRNPYSQCPQWYREKVQIELERQKMGGRGR